VLYRSTRELKEEERSITTPRASRTYRVFFQFPSASLTTGSPSSTHDSFANGFIE